MVAGYLVMHEEYDETTGKATCSIEKIVRDKGRISISQNCMNYKGDVICWQRQGEIIKIVNTLWLVIWESFCNRTYIAIQLNLNPINWFWIGFWKLRAWIGHPWKRFLWRLVKVGLFEAREGDILCLSSLKIRGVEYRYDAWEERDKRNEIRRREIVNKINEDLRKERVNANN
jgi:hypothetical protein